MSRCRPPLRLAWSLVAVLASGCGDPPPAPMDPRLEVVAMQAPGVLSVDLDGWIDNRAPVASGPAISWIPFSDVVADGVRVLVGDDLATHDTEMLRQWIAEQAAELQQLAADQDRRRLELARGLDELERAVADAGADRAVREARLAADERDEAVQRRLAQLELEVARSALARAEQRAAAAAALAATGRTPRTDVAKADAERGRARRRVAAAEEDLAAWAGAGNRALSRQQLTIAVERARRELEGMASATERIATARAKGEAELAVASRDLERVTFELGQRRAFAADPVLRAPATGTVRLKNADVRRGAKLASAPCLFVLEDRETVAYVRIPEALRDLCTVWSEARPGDGRAVVTVPAAGIELPARVASIGATAETRPEGGRAFLAVLVLDGAPSAVAALKPGMRLRAELTAAVAPRALVPAWAVRAGDDPREPSVRIAEGAVRRLRGVRVGGDFVVTEGLAPGERLNALDAEAEGTDTGRPVRGRRLTGVLAPVDALPIRLTSGNWDVVEVVPDGSRVAKGQVVARLAKTAHWIEPEKIRWNRDAGRAQADAELARARLEANQQLLDKTKAWRDADLDRAEARIKVLGDGADAARTAWEGAEGERVEADAAAVEAEAVATAADDPRMRPALSLNAAADQRLAALSARRRADSAALAAASAHWPDLLGVLSRSADYLTALDKAEDARADWHVARMQHGQARDRADRAWRRRLDELARDARELDDEELFAPADGRIFHRNTWPWRAGDSLWGREPFRLVPDAVAGGTVRRRLLLEAPAHRAGSWTLGGAMPVTVPGVGVFPGTVVQVATWYGTSTAGRLEADEGGGSTAVDEQVFNLAIDLALTATDAERVLPGMTAYVE